MGTIGRIWKLEVYLQVNKVEIMYDITLQYEWCDFHYCMVL